MGWRPEAALPILWLHATVLKEGELSECDKMQSRTPSVCGRDPAPWQHDAAYISS